MFYIAVLLGSLIYILIQLNGRLAKPDFKWPVFLKTNIVPTVINLLVGVSLVLGKNELVEVFPITFLTALLLGLSGQNIIKKLTDMLDKKVATKVGL